MRIITSVLICLGAVAACASMQPEAVGGDSESMFPHVRVDADARTVEFDASVPITVDDADAPFVYLELIACTPGTKEHEVLVVTEALPSNIHAALLMVGATAGEPGRWEWTQEEGLIGHPPSGDEIKIELVYTDALGEERVDSPQDWVVNAETGEHFPAGNWVFAGSRFIEWQGEEQYHADGAGTLIGLATFGSEVLAWPEMISHEAEVDEPLWVAAQTIPAYETAVVVRLTVVNR